MASWSAAAGNNGGGGDTSLVAMLTSAGLRGMDHSPPPPSTAPLCPAKRPLLSTTPNMNIFSNNNNNNNNNVMDSGLDESGDGEIADDSGLGGSCGGAQAEKKRRLSVEQVRSLEMSFEVENRLEPVRKMQLAQELGLQPRQVAVWFQNRRARWKTKQLERDYDLLKAAYETLAEENKKLKAQLEKLTKADNDDNSNKSDPNKEDEEERQDQGEDDADDDEGEEEDDVMEEQEEEVEESGLAEKVLVGVGFLNNKAMMNPSNKKIHKSKNKRIQKRMIHNRSSGLEEDDNVNNTCTTPDSPTVVSSKFKDSPLSSSDGYNSEVLDAFSPAAAATAAGTSSIGRSPLGPPEQQDHKLNSMMNMVMINRGAGGDNDPPNSTTTMIKEEIGVIGFPYKLDDALTGLDDEASYSCLFGAAAPGAGSAAEEEQGNNWAWWDWPC